MPRGAEACSHRPVRGGGPVGRLGTLRTVGALGARFVRHAVVNTLGAGKPLLILLSYPVISVTSITENGTALSVGDYTTNLRLGHVQRGSSLAPQRWSNGYQNIVATYVIGERIVPPIARKVALNGIERMWQSSQQALHP